MERKQTYGHLVFYFPRSGRGGKHFLKDFEYKEKTHLLLLQFYITFQWSKGVSLEKSVAAMLSEPLSVDVSQVPALFLQIDSLCLHSTYIPSSKSLFHDAKQVSILKVTSEHTADLYVYVLSHIKLLSGIEEDGSDKSFQSAKSEKDSELM
ncbi:uncharacterized protein FA14DRAFT_158862 [Meira miltonrushii]|uniref:Uncharacterized protein n=1 Tax=Meira miltonrushii TaxID=1280837 RepID=A0A316V2U4_9BASI|nr:uncharacterized protein FA14DRAFT_158862 [Meira miltonrushii]PWN31318.1 hypothetical protein FA14DRAFT_158862 [Meira miltonrushii]